MLFSLAFYVIARSINSARVKDYLATTAIGITLVGVSLSTSALQQTFGVAGHSLVLLSGYLFGIGLYSQKASWKLIAAGSGQKAVRLVKGKGRDSTLAFRRTLITRMIKSREIASSTI